MKVLVGLGNPGRKYENTRHNVGFRVIDEVARRWQIDVSRRRFDGLTGDGWFGQDRVLLLKPMTFMNLSGRSVREVMTFHKATLDDLLLIVDEMALPLGRIRVRPNGSGGGHNGLTNVIRELGDDGFARLRIGIESAEGRNAVGHVLGPFSAEERGQIDPAIISAADAVECWLAEGIDSAMNRFNRPDA